jgi:DHA1 family tetracycline resistance protein-like MFS transporter
MRESLLAGGGRGERPSAWSWRTLPLRILITFNFFFGYFTQKVALQLFIMNVSCDILLGEATCAARLTEAQRREVSEYASVWTTWIFVALNILSILGTAVLTPLSDRLGRRPVLGFTIITLAVGTGGTAIVALCTRGTLSLWLLCPCCVVCGIGGSFASLCGTMFACVADVTASASQRSRAFSLLEASIFAAGVAGPLLAGWTMALPLHKPLAHALPFLVALACYLLAALLVVAVLEESAPSASLSRLRRLGHPTDDEASDGCICTLTTNSMALMRRKPPAAVHGGQPGTRLGFLVLVFSFNYSCAVGFAQILPLYLKERFGFHSEDIGSIFALQYGAKGLLLVLILPWALSYPCCARTARPLDRALQALRAGSLAGVAAAVLLGFAPTRAALYALIGSVESVDVLPIPCTRILLSALTTSESQGAVLGLVANVESLTNVWAPLVWGYVYSATVGSEPAFALFATAGVYALCFLLSLCLRLPERPPHDSELSASTHASTCTHACAHSAPIDHASLCTCTDPSAASVLGSGSEREDGHSHGDGPTYTMNRHIQHEPAHSQPA